MYLFAFVRMYKYNLQELVFPFHRVVSGIECRSSCLPMRAFIHRAISLATQMPSFIENSKYL